MHLVDPELYQQLTTLINSMGYELYGCEQLPQGHGFIFRIYLDKPGGVTIDDCSKVSRQVRSMLTVSNKFANGFTLEVSSPGVDRPLLELRHFELNVGKAIKVRARQREENKRKFKGILMRVEGEELNFCTLDTREEVKLLISEVEKANLISELR